MNERAYFRNICLCCIDNAIIVIWNGSKQFSKSIVIELLSASIVAFRQPYHIFTAVLISSHAQPEFARQR